MAAVKDGAVSQSSDLKSLNSKLKENNDGFGARQYYVMLSFADHHRIDTLTLQKYKND
jgi:hypothetical protein